ncbi:pur operon repressor [Vaginisenegalia massiliensis]|uniref:pur operon repressor n=1 Tax=Vaginisenegalia massiliensis TaxID=2058294 RepID=UPI000F53B9A4|nr:pur operon repressor [Vaginisenegalia massiliensis]
MQQEALKIKRNHRMLYICQYLVEHPNELISLSQFVDYFNCAKSSISEDIDFVREVFEYNQLGNIQTVAGVAGGVIYYPAVKEEEVQSLFAAIEERLQDGKRILPGNYVYVADILEDAITLNKIAKLIATRYQHQEIDAVMTIETKGIGLSVAVARYLNVPYVVVRRGSSDSEGSTLSVNYVSGSLQTVMKMELSKRSLAPGSKVLIVDDFLRNGGTINGLLTMLEEFECQAAGICVFAENTDQEKQELPRYVSLVQVQINFNEDARHFELRIKPGSFFKE